MKKDIKEQPKKELAYYLTLYKIEGHETWRANLQANKDGFDKQWNSQTQGKVPKITDKNVIRVDRITGTLS